MRCYMVEFIRLFAPHIDAEMMDKIARAVTQEELDALFTSVELPLRSGTCGSLSAAA